jgi:hypothetical protein
MTKISETREEKKIMYIPKSKEWFIDRIGKRIYRDSRRYCCATCLEVEKEGVIVCGETHATYLADVDMDFGAEGVFSNYRD